MSSDAAHVEPNQKKRSRWWNTSIDWISFALICALMIYGGNADPGDVVFIYVFENIIMIIAFVPFYLVFSTWHHFYLQKNNPAIIIGKKYKGFMGAMEHALLALIILVFVFAGYVLVVFILDQISVELMVAYFQNNQYNYSSIELLARSGMFFEPSVINGMQSIMQINYGLIFLLIGLRYFGELILDFFKSDYKTNESAALDGAWSIGVHVVAGPVSIFLAMIILASLSAAFGNQTWITISTLVFFRLLFNWMSNKMIRAITEKEDKKSIAKTT